MPPRQVGVIFDRAPQSRRALVSQMATFLLWTGVTVVGAFLTPRDALHGTHQELGLPPCPSALFFDRPCPGCGLTTSWTAFIHGNFAMAFHAHALGPILYLAFTFVAMLSLLGALRGWRLRSEARWFQMTAGVLFAIVLVYGAIRFAVTPHYATAWERSFIRVSR